METLVLSAQDCPRSKGGAPEMFAWQGDEYGYCSHIGKTSSDLSEQMHAIGGCYMPVDILPCGSYRIADKQFFFATSVIESGTSRCNKIKWPYSAASSQMNLQSREIHWGMKGYGSGSALRGWTFTKARNYEIMGQDFCRYSSNSLVSGKSLQEVFPKRDELPVCRTTPMARASSLKLFMKESPPTHSLQQTKTSKHFTNRANIGRGERSSPATHKFTSCKDSDICARAVVYMDDEVHSMSYEPMHNRLANKAPQRDEKVGCNILREASPEPYQILSVRANCMKKDGKESLASIKDAPLDRIKGGEEKECASINESEGKTILCHSSPSSKRDVYKDHCDVLMPFDPILTSALSTPLAVKGYPQRCYQSVHSPPMKERWAGPAFSNSPPPSLLPVPTFIRRQLRTSSLEIP